MNKQSRFKVLNHIIYLLIFILFYVLQTTPDFLVIFGVKPALVVTIAVAIAVKEGPFIGGIYGVVAGLLMDTAAFGIFGFNSIIICILCILVGLLVENIMQDTLVSYLIYIAAITFTISALQFLFTYGIWRLQSLEKLFMKKVLLYTAYTTIISPISYYLIGKIRKTFSRE